MQGECMNRWRSSAFSLLACGLAACGGSGSSVDATPAGGSLNAAPVATNDDYRASRDNTLRVAAPGVLGNDSDGNGDLLTARLLGEPAHGALALLPDGSFSYTPAPSFTGTD